MKAIILSCLIASAFACGGDLTGSGAFSSPNYPGEYPSSANCEWTISVTGGRAMLSFNAFDVEDMATCDYDKVVVREGSSTGTILGTFCGSATPNDIIATGSTLYVLFTSDSSVQRTGFSATFSATSATPGTTVKPVGNCGGTLEGTTGEIISPGHPGNYPSNSDCTWTVTIPDGIISLSFQVLDLEASSTCSYDYLTVSDAGSGSQLAKLCGTSSTAVEGTSNSVVINFKSDSSVQQTGFKLTWSRLTCENKGGQCVASSAACDGDVIGFQCDSNQVCCQPRFEQGECGVVPPAMKLRGGNPRIVGGDESQQHAWPWQASLQTTSSSFHFCGASVITDKWIVTAAHCVDGNTPSAVKVVTGEHHQVDSSGKEQEHAVQKIIMHEGYDGSGSGFPNDIALIKLTEPIIFSKERQPICLASIEDEFLGNNCFITGWGLTQGTGDDDVLNQLNIQVLTQADCSSKWGSSYINAGHICVGNGLQGACNGDSGGPLACQAVRDGQTRWILAGATSWGRSGCQTEGYPSVYTRISYFRDWMERTIRQN